MNWSIFTSILGVLLKLWSNREKKKDRAEKQIVRLAHKMDRMAQKRADLKLRVEELEKALKEAK